jgi:predicted dehydrogenase
MQAGVGIIRALIWNRKEPMDRKLKIGVIGLGKMGIFHSALVNMNPRARLAAVHDANSKLAKYVADSGMNVAFYPDLDKMLASAAPDAVIICTPPNTHLALVRKCLEHDLDIFLEKPVAESYASAKQVVELLEGRSVIHATGFVYAHIPIFQRAKALLQEQILGRLSRFNFSVYISQVFSRKKGWLFDKEVSGGGVVIDIASHLIYLLLSYFGLPGRVYARTSSFFSEVEDAAGVLIEYPDAFSGLLDVNWSIPGYRQSAIEMTIEGENGVMEVTNDYLKLNLREGSPSCEAGCTTFHKIDQKSSTKFDLGMEGFYDEDDHFIASCLARTLPLVTWHDGLRVQQVVEAIYRSAEAGGPIALSDVR